MAFVRRHRRRKPLPKNPMNIRSNKELLLGHSLTHSKGIQKAWGPGTAKDEHDRLVRVMRDRGMKHRSPFKRKVKSRAPGCVACVLGAAGHPEKHEK